MHIDPTTSLFVSTPIDSLEPREGYHLMFAGGASCSWRETRELLREWQLLVLMG